MIIFVHNFSVDEITIGLQFHKEKDERGPKAIFRIVNNIKQYGTEPRYSWRHGGT